MPIQMILPGLRSLRRRPWIHRGDGLRNLQQPIAPMVSLPDHSHLAGTEGRIGHYALPTGRFHIVGLFARSWMVRQQNLYHTQKSAKKARHKNTFGKIILRTNTARIVKRPIHMHEKLPCRRKSKSDNTARLARNFASQKQRTQHP